MCVVWGDSPGDQVERREKRERPYDVWGVWHEDQQDRARVMSGLSVISPSGRDTCDQS